jgi:UDP-glucose 4-epimerase
MTASFNAPRALVFGARGFIGRHLVAELLAREYAVAVLTRNRSAGPTPSWAAQVTWHELGSADDDAGFASALAGGGVVFNLAGSSGAVISNRLPIESLESNCRLQLRFLAACAASRRVPHVIFASSRLVYAPKGCVPVAETDAVAPRSIYAAHKLCVEHYLDIYARAGALSYTIARITNPFGFDQQADGKSYGFVNALIDRAQRGAPLVLFGRGHQLRDYLYIRDLADALIRCAERREARGHVLNIARGRSMSMFDAALMIRERVGSGSIRFEPWPADYEAVESGDFVADVSKAAALIGFVPRYDLASGLEEMLGLGSLQRPGQVITAAAVAASAACLDSV